MDLLMDAMPEFKEGVDLEVVTRFNSLGAGKNEVWTMRDFDPLELILAP